MNRLERMTKVYRWLIYKGVGSTQLEVAKAINVDNSTLSQCLNGKVAFSNRMVKALCLADKNINLKWALDGEGEMFLNNDETGVPQSVIDSTTKPNANRDCSELVALIDKLTTKYDEHIKALLSSNDKILEANRRLVEIIERSIKK